MNRGTWKTRSHSPLPDQHRPWRRKLHIPVQLTRPRCTMYLDHLVNGVTDEDHDRAYPVLQNRRATHDLSSQASWIGKQMDRCDRDWTCGGSSQARLQDKNFRIGTQPFFFFGRPFTSASWGDFIQITAISTTTRTTLSWSWAYLSSLKAYLWPSTPKYWIPRDRHPVWLAIAMGNCGAASLVYLIRNVCDATRAVTIES